MVAEDACFWYVVDMAKVKQRGRPSTDDSAVSAIRWIDYTPTVSALYINPKIKEPSSGMVCEQAFPCLSG